MAKHNNKYCRRNMNSKNVKSKIIPNIFIVLNMSITWLFGFAAAFVQWGTV